MSYVSYSGDIHDHQSLVKAIKQVDVVISTVNHAQVADQFKIISAIKEAGNVKRFFPSEFGFDVDRKQGPVMAKAIFESKSKIRRAIEAEGIPHTYVVANILARHFLPTQPELRAIAAPLDKVVIFGDGNLKGTFNPEEAIATFTIRTVDDPRTLNKVLYIRPPANTISYNDLVSLWEKKTGKTLERVYIPEEQVLKLIQESSYPINIALSICHAAYLCQDYINIEIEPSLGYEASDLYAEVKYTTVDGFLEEDKARTPFYLNQFVPINN
uniref:NmrA-like domain-containing protein n=1 Tax=Lotus japonicus TaxID=34305 RepID=I3SB84_LOTJA|nr:unknown [Lotus japonicus]